MSETPPIIYNKNNPFPATITENRLLSKGDKETRHFIVNIAGSGLRYQPGYSLAVFPRNPPALTAALGLPPDVPVALNRVSKKFVRAVAEKLPAGARRDALTALVADEEKLNEYVYTRDYLDVTAEFPEAKFTADELIENATRVNPRLYSIASSQKKSPNEIHLVVAVVSWHTHGRDKKGLCSGYLAYDAPLHTAAVPVFLAPNKHFKLPDNPDTPIIMVGPGVGVAPFRAFLEDREATGAKGKNWLFFGDRRRATDFLYEDEFTAWQKSGLLTKLSLAFSRDQDHKIYVQDRMREEGAELWAQLQAGAYFYVCGDAKRMAKDVHAALIDIAQKHGGLTPEAADQYVNQTLMKDERRYVRDVY